ncbi:CCR4-NOT transcription complex subunit 6-like [Cichlidogyrus casuarinus]|uniref:CCR4-NOT transcription complex subunit 6-like n=1 Tax=Cichlidogyrus casuarinus TaxID=1844966 RepID=A0ABD2QL59_9PLAT
MHHQEFMYTKNSGALNQLTMQSRIMSEDEAKQGKKSDWYRVNLSGPVRNFPKGICNLKYITTLVIKSNNLERLPAEVGNLTNLLVLDASQNKIRELPLSIGELVSLRALILNENKIEDLPSECGFLLHLRHLNLQSNPLRQSIAQYYGDGSEQAVRRVIRHLMDLYYMFR